MKKQMNEMVNEMVLVVFDQLRSADYQQVKIQIRGDGNNGAWSEDNYFIDFSGDVRKTCLDVYKYLELIKEDIRSYELIDYDPVIHGCDKAVFTLIAYHNIVDDKEIKNEESVVMMNKTVKELKVMAKELGINGYSSMKKDQLIKALEDAKKEVVLEEIGCLGSKQEVVDVISNEKKEEVVIVNDQVKGVQVGEYVMNLSNKKVFRVYGFSCKVRNKAEIVTLVFKTNYTKEAKLLMTDIPVSILNDDKKYQVISREEFKVIITGQGTDLNSKSQKTSTPNTSQSQGRVSLKEAKELGLDYFINAAGKKIKVTRYQASC